MQRGLLWCRNWYRPYKLYNDLNSQPKRPGDLDLLTLKMVSPVTCDVGYLCANFGRPTPLCCQLRPDVRDRQTDVGQQHRLMPRLLGGGGIIIPMTMSIVMSSWFIAIARVHSVGSYNECRLGAKQPEVLRLTYLLTCLLSYLLSFLQPGQAKRLELCVRR